MSIAVTQLRPAPIGNARLARAPQLPKVLLLSSSLLTDRVFIYTTFLETLSAIRPIEVWAYSAGHQRSQLLWNRSPGTVATFPEIKSFKEFPHNYLRRLNEFAWDFKQQTPSRVSIRRHVRDKNQTRLIRALKVPARAVSFFKAEQKFENYVERLLLQYERSSDATARLLADRPAVVLTTGPFQFEQPAVSAAAKRLGIPSMALIPSWDNLSTKNRMVFKHDAYLVWSEQSKRELHQYYPATRAVPVYVIGAPQFDIFFQPRFVQTREKFCATQGLRPELPIIVYAVGSPNFLQEHYGALRVAECVKGGDLGRVQMIVRPHPIHDKGELKKMFQKFAPQVVVQETSEGHTPLNTRSQDEQQILEWVNTFRHADVVINLSSTVSIDAAIFDRPVINLDYDPEPNQPNQQLIKDINHVWTHFKPVAESGGVRLVNNQQELIEAIKSYLADPGADREGRRWIADYVCGYVDGRCGERIAWAVADFVARQTQDREGQHA